MGPEEHVTQRDIKEECFDFRETIETLKMKVKAQMQHDVFKSGPVSGRDHGEMKANIMLAYRHLEDARMRLGKVVQAYDGGTSVYPK